MFKNKYPLKIFAIISLVVIALTAIFVGVFGINSSIEIAGGSQLEVKISSYQGDEYNSGEENVAEYVSEIKNVLKDYGCSIDSYFVEDKLVDSYLIVRIAKSDIKNADQIPSAVATKLGIDASNVSEILQIESYFSNDQLIYVGLAILSVIIICFFAGWIRYSVLGGVTLAFAVLHNFILSLAVTFLTRVQFSIVSLVATILFSAITVFVLVVILERVKENAQSSQYANMSEAQQLIVSTKQNKMLLYISVAILAVCLVLICIPVKYVQLSALSVALCTLVAGYTSICVAPALYVYLLEIKNIKEKLRLSKDVKPNKK